MEHTITAIKLQRRNSQRVSIFLDGEYAFGLARIVAAWLTVGRVLSDDEIEDYKEQDTLEVAYQSALRFISYRPRTESEIQKKLNEKNYSEPVIAQVVERLQRNGLINDFQFAQSWVENRSTFRPRSHRALAFELRQKGVPEDMIEQVIAGTSDEETLAYQAAERKAQRFAELDRRDFRMKLAAFLGRRGFNYEVILPVVDRLWTENHQADNDADSST